jgi:hypothetical protein
LGAERVSLKDFPSLSPFDERNVDERKACTARRTRSKPWALTPQAAHREPLCLPTASPPNVRSGALVTSPLFGQLSDKLLLARTALRGVSHAERNRGREISIFRDVRLRADQVLSNAPTGGQVAAFPDFVPVRRRARSRRARVGSHPRPLRGGLMTRQHRVEHRSLKRSIRCR